MSYRCYPCESSFASTLEHREHLLLLSHHVKAAAAGDKVHSCPECSFESNSLSDYSKHVDSPDHRKKLERLRAIIDTTDTVKSPKMKTFEGYEQEDGYTRTVFQRNAPTRMTCPARAPPVYFPRDINPRANHNTSATYESHGHHRQGSYQTSNSPYQEELYYNNETRASRSYQNEPPKVHKKKSVSPAGETSKKSFLQAAKNILKRDKSKAPVLNDSKSDKKSDDGKKDKKIPRLSVAPSNGSPIAKKQMVAPIVKNDKDKWEKLAKNPKMKHSDRIRQERANKFKLADKLVNETIVNQPTVLNHPTENIFMSPPSSSNATFNESAVYASVPYQLPMSTPYNYGSAMRGYQLSDTYQDMSRIMNSDSQNTSSYSSNLSMDLNDRSLGSRLNVTEVLVKQELVDTESTMIPQSPDKTFQNNNTQAKLDSRKNKLWDLTMAEEMKRRELEECRRRVECLESELAEIAREKAKVLSDGVLC